MAKNIRFIASGSCSAIGSFAPGDIARNVDDALADHLVTEAMCAEHLKPVAAPVDAKPAPKPAAKRGSKTPTELQKDA